MEFLKETPDISLYTGNGATNIVYIKQELEEQDPLIIPDEVESNLNTMEYVEEKPVFSEILENGTIVNVQEDPVDNFTSTQRGQFVFVDCADNIDKCAEESKKSEYCLYCKKMFLQLHIHKFYCNARYTYKCIFCSSVLKRKASIRNHLRRVHFYELEGKNIDELAGAIVAGRKESNITTEVGNENSSICGVAANQKLSGFTTKDRREPVILDVNKSQNSRVSTVAPIQTSNAPFVLLNQKLNVSNVAENQKANDPVIKDQQKSIISNANESQQSKVSTANDMRISDAPLIIMSRKMNIPDMTKKGKLNLFFRNDEQKLITADGYTDKILEVPVVVDSQKLSVPLKEAITSMMQINPAEIIIKAKKTEQYMRYSKAFDDNCVQIRYHCPFCIKILTAKNYMYKHVITQHSKKVENKIPEEIMILIEAKKKVVNSLDHDLVNQKSESTVFQKLKKPEAEDSSKLVKKPVKKDTREIFSKKMKTVSQSTISIIKKEKLQEYCCNECDYKTKQKSQIRAHIKENHTEKFQRVLKFSKCTKEFQKEKNLKRHEANCGIKFDYPCLFCLKISNRLGCLKQHVLMEHLEEMAGKNIDEVMREIVANKETFDYPSMDPDKIDASNLEHILRYCIKCKKLASKRTESRIRTNKCKHCGTQMVYLCSKCKDKTSVNFYGLKLHWKRCTENNQTIQRRLDEIMVYFCSDCPFSSTYKYKMAMHLTRNKHKMADELNNADKDVERGENNQKVDIMDVYDEAKFAVQQCVIDLQTMSRRYCPKCEKVVTSEMQECKTTTKEICQVCKTLFYFQCVKCNVNCATHETMRYHLSSKCFPGDYSCTKCHFRAPNWQLMQKHLRFNHTDQHPSYLCELCSFRTKYRTNFWAHLNRMHRDKDIEIGTVKNKDSSKKEIIYFCDKCSFSTKQKFTLKRHLITVHNPKKYKCTMCKFKTKYEHNLQRHIFTKHQNYY